MSANFYTDVRVLTETVRSLDISSLEEGVLDSDLIAFDAVVAARKALADIEKRMSSRLGDRMGQKRTTVPEVGQYQRDARRDSTKCIDEDALWRFVIDTRIVDPETGEVLPTHEVIRLVYGSESKETGKVRLTGASPTKVEAIGVDPDDFFEKGSFRGWNVKRIAS